MSVTLSSAWNWLKRIILWMLVLQLVYIIVCKWFDPPITLTQLGSVVTGDGLHRDYITYDEMGPNIKLAVMAGEDQLFPDHNGFDIKSIKKAMKFNEKHPNRVRGASTISQQTAKNVFLWQKGGYFRKGLEVYFTFMIEKIWGKERILETYLNVAEMGKGIYGVQSAARHYFNKDAKNLSRQEAAMIAACLPNPVKYTVKPLSRYVANRSAILLRQMNNLEGDTDIQELLR
ncbi:MAG: monofunctional biosynthetic peptidoglycan transglycosylase [Ferruginibacter sp.]